MNIGEERETLDVQPVALPKPLREPVPKEPLPEPARTPEPERVPA